MLRKQQRDLLPYIESNNRNDHNSIDVPCAQAAKPSIRYDQHNDFYHTTNISRYFAIVLVQLLSRCSRLCSISFVGLCAEHI